MHIVLAVSRFPGLMDRVDALAQHLHASDMNTVRWAHYTELVRRDICQNDKQWHVKGLSKQT